MSLDTIVEIMPNVHKARSFAHKMNFKYEIVDTSACLNSFFHAIKQMLVKLTYSGVKCK